MKQREIKELHALSVDELKKMLIDAKAKLFQLHMNHSQLKVKNTSEIKSLRDDIARILTIIRRKEIEHGKSI